jgi:hypothetical protein
MMYFALISMSAMCLLNIWSNLRTIVDDPVLATPLYSKHTTVPTVGWHNNSKIINVPITLKLPHVYDILDSQSSNVPSHTKHKKIMRICGDCQRDGGTFMWEQDYATEIFGQFQCEAKCSNDSDVYWYMQGRFQDTVADILFHTSDEFCNRAHVVDHYRNFKQVFRQYACHKQYAQEYNEHRNVKIIPLGYMFGTFPTSSVDHAKKIMLRINSTRNKRWSFVGNVEKSDRLHAIDVFRNITPNFHGSSEKQNIVSIYEESDFVVSPRGNVNLDCFRHYEASVNGAIPVIVGDFQEVYDTFGHFVSKPPWLFAASWQEARDTAVALVADRKSLVKQRTLVVEWWMSEMQNLTI